MDKPELLTYVLTETALMNDPDGNCRIYQAGSEIKYAGLPSENMIPVCEKGRARLQEARELSKKPPVIAPIENIGSVEREAAAAAVQKAKDKAKALAREKKEQQEDLA
jgi:hypothetical protein